MCCSYKRIELWIWFFSFMCILCSLGVAIPMFILAYPGTECLLFVSVRGEALIYGNPAGCNFISYGHCVVVVLTLLMVGMILCSRNKNGFMGKGKGETSPSNRTLPGTNQSALSTFSMSTMQRFRFTQIYSTNVMILGALLTVFVTLTAMVLISGYSITCDELAYETRRQIYGKTTLGTPIKHLDIACNSLFRDVDFHTRFHFDHYEYSGQWHAQYRGYKHGRIHKFESKHEHVLPVYIALELCIAFAFISSALWITLIIMMIYFRKKQKLIQKREVAESMEDARIYATTSRDQIGLQHLNSDQISLGSQQSSILTTKSHSLNPRGGNNSPQLSYPLLQNGPGVGTHHMAGSVPVLQQQGTQQQQQPPLFASQPVLNHQNSALLTPNPPQAQLHHQQLQVNNHQHIATQQQLQSQLQLLQQQQIQLQQIQQSPQKPNQLPPAVVQQQLPQPMTRQITPQNTQNIPPPPPALAQSLQENGGLQYMQMSNGLLVPVNQVQNNIPSPNNIINKNSNSPNKPSNHTYSSIQETLKEDIKSGVETPNNAKAQKDQVDLSKGIGLKCSQI